MFGNKSGKVWYMKDEISYTYVRNEALWKNGKVYYRFNHQYGRFTLHETDLVKEIMVDVSLHQLSAGCVSFIELQEDEIHEGHVLEINKKSPECKAVIGSSKGSFMTLGSPACFQDEGETILHEIGHVLGQYHEHNRPDRDDFIEVLEDEIDEVAVITGALQIKHFNIARSDHTQVPYDMFSIMHYHERGDWCKFDSPCIILKQPYKDLAHFFRSNPLDYFKQELSPVDNYKISKAYKCEVKPEVQEKYLKYKNELARIKNP